MTRQELLQNLPPRPAGLSDQQYIAHLEEQWCWNYLDRLERAVTVHFNKEMHEENKRLKQALEQLSDYGRFA